MRRLLSLLLSLLLLAATTAGAASSHDAVLTTDLTGARSGAGQGEEPPAGLQIAQSTDQTAGVVVTQDAAEYPNNEVLVMYDDGACEVRTYPDDDTLAAALDELAEEEGVCLVQPNYTYENQFLSTTDALVNKQWALDNQGDFAITWEGGKTAAVAGVDIGLAEAWSLCGDGSRDVIVAVLDTGVDITHPELRESILVNGGEIPGNGIDDDGNGYMDDVYGWNFYHGNNQVYSGTQEDFHGTHGAGTILAAADNGIGIAGIVQSDRVKLLPVKVLGGSNGLGSTLDLIQGIRYAEARGADICNLSLGGSQNDPALYRTIASSSMLFVVAAGNEGRDTDVKPSYPASYALNNIISVANITCDGTLFVDSNYGAVSVDLAAPGTAIYSTAPQGQYGYSTGTSMASPMVTAAAAMLYAQDPSVTLQEVRQLILDTVQPLSALRGKTVTGGTLDLGAAMKALTAGQGQSAGSAPVVDSRQYTSGDRHYLLVQITDADGDLSQNRYSPGSLTAAQFQGGTVGQSFSLAGDGTILFQVEEEGDYTFYARDKAGNETVEVITVDFLGIG
ncbi:MAG TPA: S8 family serine peptidase [Candidatus Evtepia faecigallinarum]|nr:S8 family serine peptidase [Candidatus Evtepia faecigallinarum]